jgi:SOS-response transcriptional repressor LexA|tara:strand:+ start:555 stop:791 length:237 start_codon:yes stop_codon:yes gene_type:complete
MIKNSTPMTPKMMGVLKYLKKYIKSNEMSPTIRKIQTDLGYASPNSITVLINKLIARGEVKKIADNKARNLVLNGKSK